VRVSIQRSSNGQWWTGSGWSSTQQSVVATGTTSWSIQVPTNQLGTGISYTVTSWSLQGAAQSPNTVRTFVYDTSGPTTTGTSFVTTDKDGAVEVGDTFSVTFSEALDATSVPASATLTLSKGFLSGTTNWGISGLSQGTRTTGAGGYLTTGFSSRTVTYAGTLTLSNNNQTVTFTVTGSCSGSCGNVSTSPASGAFQYVPANTLRDVAGNAPATTVITASPATVMF
jgi:hypothetical protein